MTTSYGPSRPDRIESPCVVVAEDELGPRWQEDDEAVETAKRRLAVANRTQYIYKLHKIVEAVPVETPVEIRVTEVE